MLPFVLKKLGAKLNGFVVGSSKTGIPEELALPVGVFAHLTVSGGVVHQMRPITIGVYPMALLTDLCSPSQVRFPWAAHGVQCWHEIEIDHTKKASRFMFVLARVQWADVQWASVCNRQPIHSCTHFAATPLACSFNVHCHVSSKAAWVACGPDEHARVVCSPQSPDVL